MATEMKSLNFGIEIETVGLDRNALAAAIKSVVGGQLAYAGNAVKVVMADGRAWSVVPDGSLSGGSLSGEVVSPILGYADIETLQNIVRAIRKAGGRADSSCGIHIHVDGSRFNAKAVANLAKMVHKQERLLELALGVREHRLTRYCKPIEASFIAAIDAAKPSTMPALARAWYGYENAAPSRYDSSRYHGLNLNSLFYRETIEFRYFNGTLHAGEIKSYIQLVLALSAKAIDAKSTQSARREFSAATAKYDFRVVLLGLGMIGDEFKTARLHLLKNLEGSAAWKNGRPENERAAA